jgi:hypothetical protein
MDLEGEQQVLRDLRDSKAIQLDFKGLKEFRESMQ